MVAPTPPRGRVACDTPWPDWRHARGGCHRRSGGHDVHDIHLRSGRPAGHLVGVRRNGWRHRSEVARGPARLGGGATADWRARGDTPGRGGTPRSSAAHRPAAAPGRPRGVPVASEATRGGTGLGNTGDPSDGATDGGQWPPGPARRARRRPWGPRRPPRGRHQGTVDAGAVL